MDRRNSDVFSKTTRYFPLDFLTFPLQESIKDKIIEDAEVDACVLISVANVLTITLSFEDQSEPNSAKKSDDHAVAVYSSLYTIVNVKNASALI